ncbi:MAG: helix-turn-helix transcriptional regulator [Clostridia bacterium]|nr:helix-turn-helix transcriptional regulator [Clostridia bacterium]
MNYSSSEFSKKLTSLCENRGLSPRQTLKNVFGMDGSNLQKWRSNESTPKADLYLAVAEYFGVTTDYLYGRELPASADTLAELTPEEKQLIAQLRQTDEERVKLALAVLDVLLR